MSSGSDEYWKTRKKDQEIKDLLDRYKPENESHFFIGWQMYPNWWSQSTKSWKQGFNARMEKEEKRWHK